MVSEGTNLSLFVVLTDSAAAGKIQIKKVNCKNKGKDNFMKRQTKSELDMIHFTRKETVISQVKDWIHYNSLRIPFRQNELNSDKFGEFELWMFAVCAHVTLSVLIFQFS